MAKINQGDVFSKLSANARKVLLIDSRLAEYSASVDANHRTQNVVSVKHLFAGVLLVPDNLALRVLQAMRVDPRATLNRLGYGFLADTKINDLTAKQDVKDTSINASTSTNASRTVNIGESTSPNINTNTIKVDPSNSAVVGKNAKFSDLSNKISVDSILADKLNRNERNKKIALDMQVKDILSNAYHLANKYDLVYVGTEHIMLALLGLKNNPFVEELKYSGLDLEQFMKTLSITASYPMGILVKPENIGEQEGNIPLLSQLGTDVTQKAKEGLLDPIIGRNDEIDQIINILGRRKKNNPIIVGEAGVGKTALIEGLAQRIVAGTVPGSLIGTRIFSVDIPSIIAGSKMRGDVEEKVLEIINEVVSNKNIIFFIDEIQNIMTAGSSGSGFDISSILKPALLSGDFRCIGATTLEDYTRYFEEDNALARRFQQVLVEEPSIEDSIKILKRIKPILEKHHNIMISDDALVGAVKLSDRFIVDRYLPDKAIDLLDEATASRRLEVEVKYKGVADLGGKLEDLDGKTKKAVKAGRLEQAIEFRKQKLELEKKLSANK